MKALRLLACACIFPIVLFSLYSAAADAGAQERRSAPAWFRIADTNHDGVLTPEEWQAAFDRLDTDHDRRLSWNEIAAPREPSGTVDLSTKSPAFRAGYDRGRVEGRQAGIEDKPKHWDLEGQRELEQADSGYQPSVGPRTEYQEGYRAGFRSAYTEVFGPRR